MTKDEYTKELRKLYELAVKQGKIDMAAELLERLRRTE